MEEKKEEKKYVNVDEYLKSKEGSRTTSTLDTFASRIAHLCYKVNAEIVEKQDELIMQAVQTIGGDTYHHITIDRNKVIDALSKSIPKKPVEGKCGRCSVIKCPTCGKWLCITVPTFNIEDYNYCGRCGQAISWSDYLKEVTDD